jgi:cytoskeleton protein RodZ
MSNFGANFRKAREAAGLPLEKIAAETRISTRFLTAIENEAFHLLPGGIFNRGFIRAYAEYLGLDSNQAVADYDRMSATAQEATDALRDVERAPSRSSDWNLYLVAAAILVALMVAYYFVTRKPTTTERPTEPAAVAQPATAAPAPADTPAPPATATASEANQAAPSVSAPAKAAIQPVAPVQSTPAPAVPAPSPATPSTPSTSPSALAVNVNVTDSTWMKVTTDGAVALSEILQAGTSRRFSAERSIEVIIGNAAGATMQINGRDLGQLGTSGRVREFRITPENAAQIR